MGNRKEPTNAELYEKLGRIELTLQNVFEQTKKTNGRVTRLEKWKEKLDIIEVYKKENSTTTVTTVGTNNTSTSQPDWTKLGMGLIGVLGTALAIISYLVGQR